MDQVIIGIAIPLFGNTLFLGIVYFHGITSLIYIGLAKPHIVKLNFFFFFLISHKDVLLKA
jgi:hypothetical protein